MKIYLLTGANDFKAYGNVRIKEEAHKAGHTIRFLTQDKFEIVISGSNQEQVFYNGKPLKDPDVFIPRHSVTYFTHMITRYFEKKSNVIVMNGSVPRQTAKDKMRSLQFLTQNNIPVPKSILAKFPLNIDFIESHLGYPIVVKRNDGSHGKGIMLCENRNQFEDLVEMLSAMPNIESTNFILQEFIAAKIGQDIRVFVVGGRAIGAMLRTGKEGDFKANFSGGGTTQKFEMTPEVEWLAVESAKVIGLEIAGVDILFDKEGYRICEINASPGFEGFEKATRINVPKAILRYLNLRLSNKK